MRNLKIFTSNIEQEAINQIDELLEQALDEIEKILRQPQFEYDNIPCNYDDDIEKIKEIIQKAKGERLKYER